MTDHVKEQVTQALVVGGNGGIGFGFVQNLLSQPTVKRVYATYHNPARAQDLTQLAKQMGDRLQVLALDITDEAQIAERVAQIQADTPKLHQVINCVGLLHGAGIAPEKSLRQINSEQLLRYFQVNSIGSVLLAKHLVPLLRHGDRSLFACISAKVGSIGDNRLGGWYGYRASKAALNMFMKTIALEYSRKSPQTIVVSLHPGTTDTDLSKPFQTNVPPEKLFPVERTVEQLLTVMAGLTLADSGSFYSWDGTLLPW